MIYVPTAAACEPAVAALRASLERRAALDGRAKVLGFDVEWRVTFERGAGARPVATLQLSTYDMCAVFHIIHFEVGLRLGWGPGSGSGSGSVPVSGSIS